MIHRSANNLVLVHLNDFPEHLIYYVKQPSGLIFPTACVYEIWTRFNFSKWYGHSYTSWNNSFIKMNGDVLLYIPDRKLGDNNFNCYCWIWTQHNDMHWIGFCVGLVCCAGYQCFFIQYKEYFIEFRQLH